MSWLSMRCVRVYFSYKRITDFLPSLSSQFLNEKTISHDFTCDHSIHYAIWLLCCVPMSIARMDLYTFLTLTLNIDWETNQMKKSIHFYNNVMWTNIPTINGIVFNSIGKNQFIQSIWTITKTTTIILQMKQWTELKSQFYQRCKCVYVQVLYNVDKYIYRKHWNCSIEKWWKRTSIAHSLPLLTTVVVVLHLFFWLILFSIAFSISTTRFSDKHFFSQRYP